MAINKTSAIDLNVPTKVISVTVTSASSEAQWEHDDGLGDIWWSGGSQPKSYRWELTMTVIAVAHGSHLTRTPKVFNGFDIVVGDYIAGASDGRALQIVSITSKTATTVVCKVEDRLRYNTFRSATGNGIFSVPGGAVVFQINENGHPMIDPLPTGIVSSDFYANVSSRFQYLNPQMNYMLDQTAHGFEAGDVVAMDHTTNVFELADAGNIERLVGTITHSGPGPNKFLLRPANGIVDFVPGLPGNPGDFIYPKTDSSGDLTLTNTGVAIFLKLSNAIPSISLGSVIGGSSSAADKLEINDTDVLFTTNSGGVVSINNAVTDINTLTTSHKVTASSTPAPNTITSDSGTYGSAYGLVGGYVPFSASINGAPVNFSTSTAGQAAYGIAVGIAEDMATDINAANINNITASFDVSGNLILVHSQGTAFTIVNGTADANGNDFAGNGSVASLGTSYSAASGATLKLTRTDGGEIILFDKVGTPTLDFGVMSGHSGSYSLGLNVEKGIRSGGGITVVANMAARNAMSPLTGDQAHVLDTGEGEWALYLYSGSSWTLIANEDSAATDANSLSHTFTTPVGGFGNTSTIVLGRISSNSRVLSVLVEVTNVMTGYTTIPSLEVGVASDPDRFMGADENDLESSGSYVTNPDYHYAGATELEIKCALSHYGSTAGDIKVTVTYV